MTRTVRTPIPGLTAAALVRSWTWGWAAIGQLILDLMLSFLYFLIPLIALIGIVTVPVLLVGAPLLLITLALSLGLAGFERARVLALTGIAVPASLPQATNEPFWRRLLLQSRPWRALLHITAITLWGWLAGTAITALTSTALAAATVPAWGWALPEQGLHLPFGGRIDGFWWLLLVFGLGVLGLAVLPLLARGLVMVDVLLARRLLGPGRGEQVERLSERVDTLTQTRVATVDSVEVERRRIERDLHDGPQQRLVAIAMDLGMAQERIDRDPAGARELLDKAHAASKEAITEMRMVARGIHPPILTDRGLDAALSALAARSPVPVGVRVELPVRPSPTVEAIAYFCVSEALTNVAKHARATSAQVSVTSRSATQLHQTPQLQESPQHQKPLYQQTASNQQTTSNQQTAPHRRAAENDQTTRHLQSTENDQTTDEGQAISPAGSTPAALIIEVRDDGIGGANPDGGTGLHGLADRVRAIDGTLVVQSPSGGPTVLTITLPWSRS